MNKLILVFGSLCFMFLLSFCGGDDPQPAKEIEWKSLGLKNHIVNKVLIYKNNLYAVTDKGFYVKNRKEQSQNWQLLGFENKKCQSFLIFNENEIIVSLVDRGDPSQNGIFKTDDGGNSWFDFSNGFGGGEDVEPAFDISVNPSDSSILYAVGYYVVARSSDRGLSWNPVFGEWQGFASGLSVVKANPRNPQSLWAGGQNGIEQGFLLYSKNYGNDWEHWLNLVEAPSVAKEICFHPRKAQEVYVGFEGGLIKTPDDGVSWEKLLESDESRFFFGIGINKSSPEKLYTAGWIKRFDEPQPFIIYQSKNGGQTWQEHEYEEEDFGGVYDMELISEEGKDKLYLGLFKGGVYEVVFNNP
ncbi:MAG: glycoside hydrolase [Bacteroidota bacterium]|nr:glycoside hydrolase [Bacteroidota bacterium]